MPENSLRVLEIIVGLDIGNVDGGRERFGIELARQLKRDAVDVSVCAFWKRGGQTEMHWCQVLQLEGIEVFFAGECRDKFSFLQYLLGIRQIANYCQTHQINIIHSHYQMASLAAVFFKLFRYTSVIRTLHISGLEWGKGSIGWVLEKIITNCFFSLCVDAEVGISQAAVDQLKRRTLVRWLGKPIYLIHNALPADFLENENQAAVKWVRFGIENKLIVGCMGRLSEQKGYLYLIQAIPYVIEKFPHVHFVFAGDGELKSRLEKTAEELQVLDHVLFAGQTREVVPFLKSLDLFVLPSLWEGLPTVILESMACGIPVLATDIPGTRELVQHGITGWLVPLQSPIELGNAIVELLENPQTRQGLAERGKRMSQNFTMPRISQEYIALFQDVVHDN
ncbi:MAG: glycosyltransferase family 4 protein [Chloroflexi bacterium]|nr:glycosyltransferase family 4 protein [Chloroflexota bacterium]